ncbi:MAG: hypothetical protein VX272_01830 [Planctomycetota bacterium]|nr:hypothetical protein [Planctomycetota bacterium]
MRDEGQVVRALRVGFAGELSGLRRKSAFKGAGRGRLGSGTEQVGEAEDAITQVDGRIVVGIAGDRAGARLTAGKQPDEGGDGV